MNDLLQFKLDKLQKQYKSILQKACNSTDLSIDVIDEINVFWKQNKKLVYCILQNMFEPNSTYIFTAATFMDVDDLEHYPFIALGKHHILDDPICRYARIINVSDGDFNDQMKEQIVLTINDNIKILENYNDSILILPIRYLEDDTDLIYQASEQAFLSMFNEEMDFKKYKASIVTAEDIKKAFLPDAEKSIIFSEDDDNNLPFRQRLEQYKNNTPLPFGKNASDADVFWFAMCGFLTQAFNIILMCAHYEMIPYIRYDVAFKYLLRISSNFSDVNIEKMIFKSAVANILYQTFDKSRFERIQYHDYINALKQSNFSENVFAQLESENINLHNPQVAKTAKIISYNVDEVFKEITK